MTGTGERGAGGRWPTADRSLLATVLGMSPAAAVGMATVLTGLGVFVDLVRIGSLGVVFTVCHVTGCVLAVAWVRRDSLFAPLVQPPLLVAVAVPVVVLLAGYPEPGAGVAERLLVIGAPLVNAFPTMAWTTGLVLALGVVRVAVQTPPGPGDKRRKGSSSPTPASRSRPGGTASTAASRVAAPRDGASRDGASWEGGPTGYAPRGSGSRGGAARGAARTPGSPRRS